MNDMQIFENEEFGQIRMVEIEGKPYFIANDVARALGYKRPADAVTAHCKGSVKHRYPTDGGEQEVKVIPEGDVYRLVIKSQLPDADRFERWVFDDVIPSIRRTGSYSLPMTTSEQIKLLAQGNVELNQKIEKVENDLQEFKDDMPLLTIECETISRAAKKKGVEVLGGKQSEAYRDKSLRGRVYGDIYRELKRQFNVNSYKAIRRRDCKKAVGIVESYKLPVFLEEQVNDSNAQMRLNDK